MGAGDDADFVRLLDLGKSHEALQIDLLRAARAWVVAVGKSLGFSRHGRELVEFGSLLFGCGWLPLVLAPVPLEGRARIAVVPSIVQGIAR
jgi:hypothetical protein